jgi:hypothetical protein
MAENSKIDHRDYYVTVCDHCLMASCWHGETMCMNARKAGTKQILASELLRLTQEHPSNYSPQKLTRVCGGVQWL